MMNLLPNHEKENIRREYRYRLLVVSLATFLIVLVVANALLTPSFVLSKVKLSITKNQFEELRDSETGEKRDELRNLAEETNNRAKFLSSGNESQSAQGVIQEILQKRGNIALTAFLYKNGQKDVGGSAPSAKTTPPSLQLKGIAKNRMELIHFRDRLEEDDMFQKIVLPVSSLVSERDIEFTMEIEVKVVEKEKPEEV